MDGLFYVYFRDNPNLKWIGYYRGKPDFRTPPYGFSGKSWENRGKKPWDMAMGSHDGWEIAVKSWRFLGIFSSINGAF